MIEPSYQIQPRHAHSIYRMFLKVYRLSYLDYIGLIQTHSARDTVKTPNMYELARAATIRTTVSHHMNGNDKHFTQIYDRPSITQSDA